MSDEGFVYQDPDDIPEQEDVEVEEEEQSAGDELEFPVGVEEEDQSDEIATVIARKWRGFGSELEVNQEKVTPTRPLITLTVHRLRKHFGDDCNFHDSDPGNIHMFASFPSKDPTLKPFIHRMEIDRGIQVKEQSVDISTQTGMSFKRNKMVQSSTQAISDENVQIIMKSKNMAHFFKSAMPRLEKAMQQNEMVDLLFNDYKNLKAKHGHELEFREEAEQAGIASGGVPGGVSGVDGAEDQHTGEKHDVNKMDWMRLHKAERETVTKREGTDEAEELEQEERLNKEYLEFLKFQTEIVEILKTDEPEFPTEDQSMADEFEALVRAAQQVQAQEDAEAAAILEAEEEEEDELQLESATTEAPAVSATSVDKK